jgi:hypothetical protein
MRTLCSPVEGALLFSITFTIPFLLSLTIAVACTKHSGTLMPTDSLLFSFSVSFFFLLRSFSIIYYLTAALPIRVHVVKVVAVVVGELCIRVRARGPTRGDAHANKRGGEIEAEQEWGMSRVHCGEEMRTETASPQQMSEQTAAEMRWHTSEIHMSFVLRTHASQHQRLQLGYPALLPDLRPLRRLRPLLLLLLMFGG